jgi:predicted RNase H-like HicB family nuclease
MDDRAKTVRVIFHHEDGSWWAESPDVDRWYAAGDSYAEVAKLAKEGIPFALTAAIEELLDATRFHDSDLNHMT